MKFRIVIASVLLIGMLPAARSELRTFTTPHMRITVTKISDDRHLSFPPEEDVELKLTGSLATRSCAISARLTGAVDDVGDDLLKNSMKRYESYTMYDPVDPRKFTLDLWGASRQARSVQRVSGTLLMFQPQMDPRCSITVPFTDILHRNFRLPFASPVLRAAHLSIYLMTREQYGILHKQSKTRPQSLSAATKDAMQWLGMNFHGPNELTEHTVDPDSKLVSMAWEDRNGKALSYSQTIDVYSFDRPLPPGAKLHIYVATPRSLAIVPFQFRNLPLP